MAERGGRESSPSASSSSSEKFAPRFDGLRFIETLITAHRWKEGFLCSHRIRLQSFLPICFLNSPLSFVYLALFCLEKIFPFRLISRNWEKKKHCIMTELYGNFLFCNPFWGMKNKSKKVLGLCLIYLFVSPVLYMILSFLPHGDIQVVSTSRSN